MIGIGRQPLGVDIEPLDAAPPPDDSMTTGERLELSAGSSVRALDRWTAKEAHAKLFGATARLDPAAIDTRVENDAVCVLSPAGHSTCYVRNFRDTVQAVAVHGSRW